jgi:hypothetical protein
MSDYYRCVTTAADKITTVDLPPHDSNYYATSNANHVDFDTSRGSAYHANPNVLSAKSITFTFPESPVSRGLAITSAMVDGVVGTDANEYALGPVGIAIDSVALFNPLAAPGDDIETEKYTFDDYSGHPAPDGTYHYHADSKGPLEISPVGFYGVMCDGTVVLGCDEIDGTTPAASDLDAQGGHVGDITDAHGALFTARYHTHICPATGRKYTPEIQYYTTCGG